MVVLFPEPLGPRKANTSPRRTLKLTPSTATRSSKRLVSPRTSITGQVASDGGAVGKP
jgi:hypothetical protein